MTRIATVGTFDGMHRGHTEVLQTLKRAAKTLGMTPLAISFSSHPLSLIAPERAPKSIMTPQAKRLFLENEGVETILLDFTRPLASLSVRDWLSNLRDNYQVGAIVIGYDNTFGSDGRFISHDDYVRIAGELNLKCILADEIPGISSSAVRRDILAGNLRQAAEKLGRPFSISGIVVEGNRIGRTIGFPTANLRPDLGKNQILPPPGVYAAMVRIGKSDIEEDVDYEGAYKAVCNIGFRPTLDPSLQEPEPGIEAFLLDFKGELYGRHLRIELIERLRPEEKFPNLDALKEQISRDVCEARRILGETSNKK